MAVYKRDRDHTSLANDQIELFFWSFKRVFEPSKAMRWLCYAGAFICTAFYVAEIFHDLFICIPVQEDYDPKLPGHCLPSGVGGSITAIFTVIPDLCILVLPLPFVWSLQMKLRSKLRLMALFGLGALEDGPSALPPSPHCHFIYLSTHHHPMEEYMRIGSIENTSVNAASITRPSNYLGRRFRQRHQLENIQGVALGVSCQVRASPLP